MRINPPALSQPLILWQIAYLQDWTGQAKLTLTSLYSNALFVEHLKFKPHHTAFCCPQCPSKAMEEEKNNWRTWRKNKRACILVKLGVFSIHEGTRYLFKLMNQMAAVHSRLVFNICLTCGAGIYDLRVQQGFEGGWGQKK